MLRPALLATKSRNGVPIPEHGLRIVNDQQSYIRVAFRTHFSQPRLIGAYRLLMIFHDSADIGRGSFLGAIHNGDEGQDNGGKV